MIIASFLSAPVGPDPICFNSSLKQGFQRIPRATNPLLTWGSSPIRQSKSGERERRERPAGSPSPPLAGGPCLGRGFPNPAPQGHRKKLTSFLSFSLGCCDHDSFSCPLLKISPLAFYCYPAREGLLTTVFIVIIYRYYDCC